MKRTIIIVLAVAIILGLIFWLIVPRFFGKKAPDGPITLTYFGLWEEDSLIKPVIDEYQKQNPSIIIKYERQSSINYRTRVQTQIRSGVGPDVFRIHNSWLAMFKDDLTPAPQDIFTLTNYRNLFYPISIESFVSDNKIYAAPIEIDGLGLFVNEDMLKGVGGEDPITWQDFIDTAKLMTVRDATGIKTAGAALGTASNVDHFSDILGLLLLQQPEVDFNNLVSDKAAEVLDFYTSFVTDPNRKTWDVNLPDSKTMFIQGRLGFYFAPSWRAHELRVANPNLNFKVIPVPQLNTQRIVNWATFWGEGVSKTSNHPKEAWQFIKFLTSPEAEKLMYQEASKIRLFGEPYSLTSLRPEIENDPISGAFVKMGPNYKFWYLASNTFDGGINDNMIKYFEDGVNSTLRNGNSKSALITINQGVKQVLDQFLGPAASP